MRASRAAGAVVWTRTCRIHPAEGLREVLRARKSSSGWNHSAMSQSELPEFETLWDYAEPAASEARFRQLLAETHARSEPADRAALLTQIARAQGLQPHFDTAHATLEAALALLRQDDRRAQGRVLPERGRVVNSCGAAAITPVLFF